MIDIDEILCVTPSWGEGGRELHPPETPLDEAAAPILPPPVPMGRTGTYPKSREGAQSDTVRAILDVLTKRGTWMSRTALGNLFPINSRDLTQKLGNLYAAGKLERRRVRSTVEYRISAKHLVDKLRG